MLPRTAYTSTWSVRPYQNCDPYFQKKNSVMVLFDFSPAVVHDLVSLARSPTLWWTSAALLPVLSPPAQLGWTELHDQENKLQLHYLSSTRAHGRIGCTTAAPSPAPCGSARRGRWPAMNGEIDGCWNTRRWTHTREEVCAAYNFASFRFSFYSVSSQLSELRILFYRPRPSHSDHAIPWPARPLPRRRGQPCATSCHPTINYSCGR